MSEVKSPARLRDRGGYASLKHLATHEMICPMYFKCWNWVGVSGATYTYPKQLQHLNYVPCCFL